MHTSKTYVVLKDKTNCVHFASICCMERVAGGRSEPCVLAGPLPLEEYLRESEGQQLPDGRGARRLGDGVEKGSAPYTSLYFFLLNS